MGNLIGALLSETVLYTLKGDKENHTRVGLEKFLTGKKFIKEGDQSTMIRRAGFTKLNPRVFFNELNELCKNVEFSNGDTISLIVPTIIKRKKLNGPALLHPYLQRYKYIFDKSSNSFSVFFEKRDLILYMQGNKNK